MRNYLNDILNENCLLTQAQISQELTTYLSIRPLSHPRLSVTSCYPNIEFTLVYKYTMILYSMAHEPGGMVDSFFAGQQGGFVHLGVAVPILQDSF